MVMGCEFGKGSIEGPFPLVDRSIEALCLRLLGVEASDFLFLVEKLHRAVQQHMEIK